MNNTGLKRRSMLLKLSAILPGTALLASAAPKKKKQQDKKSKQQSAIDKFNAVHEVEQKVVDECAAIAGELKLQAKPAKPRRVLVYAVSPGAHRFGIPTDKAALKVFGEKTGAFTAVVSDDLANFEPEALKQFDAVCFANTTGDVFSRPIAKHLYDELTADEKKAQAKNATRLVKNLTDYVRNGGGFFGIHAATDSLKKEPVYGDMIGAYFNGHPWGGGNTVTVNLEEPNHALCKNAFGGNSFSIKDEMYQFKEPYDRSKLRVLLSIDLEKSDKPDPAKMKRTDGDYPVAWVKPYGKGRIFYCSLGHNAATFAHPLVLKFWANGFQYVIGDLKAEDAQR